MSMNKQVSGRIMHILREKYPEWDEKYPTWRELWDWLDKEKKIWVMPSGRNSNNEPVEHYCSDPGYWVSDIHDNYITHEEIELDIYGHRYLAENGKMYHTADEAMSVGIELVLNGLTSLEEDRRKREEKVKKLIHKYTLNYNDDQLEYTFVTNKKLVPKRVRLDIDNKESLSILYTMDWNGDGYFLRDSDYKGHYIEKKGKPHIDYQSGIVNFRFSDKLSSLANKEIERLFAVCSKKDKKHYAREVVDDGTKIVLTVLEDEDI